MSEKNRVLIIEDSKAFAGLLKSVIEKTHRFECDIAESKAACLQLLEKKAESYFVAIVDLNLPDAEPGEGVDIVNTHKIPILVFTGSTDPKLKNELWRRGIADYAIKSHSHSLEYVVWMVNRIYMNRLSKVLVVDDSFAEVKQMEQMLKTQNYQVAIAKTGLSAIEIVQSDPNIVLVVLDCHLKNEIGMEIASTIRDNHSRYTLEILGISGKNDAELSAQFIKSGANDFLVKPFTPEEFLCRVNHAVDRIDNYKKLKELNQTKNRLLGTAAHDIRGPIGAIRTAADYLMKYSPDEKKTTKMLEMIQKSSAGLISLLNDLLDVSAIESGELKLNCELTDFTELVTERIELYGADASAKNLNTSQDILAQCEMNMDAVKMRQVIDNLITNAIKYSPVGGDIRYELKTDNKNATFSAYDSGPGISDDEQKKLFKPFQVLSSKTTGGEKATGLGLAIAKNVVQAHKGSLTYQNIKEGGACFSVSLPINNE